MVTSSSLPEAADSVDADDATKARHEYGMLIALGWLQEEMVAALET